MPAMTQTPQLSKLEWSAVAVALKDAGRFGWDASQDDAAPGWVARIATALFGVQRATRLADVRLEAVRRFVYASRRRRAPASELMPALAEQGFSSAQIDALALLSL